MDKDSDEWTLVSGVGGSLSYFGLSFFFFKSENNSYFM